jgi:transcriptional regulator with XRE-family HTH domain
MDEYEETIEQLKLLAANRREAELARQLGVPRTTLHQWLSGKREPTARSWIRIQAFLKA